MGLTVTAEAFFNTLNAQERNDLADVVLSTLSPSEILTKMDGQSKDSLYRMLWSEYLCNDVQKLCQSLGKPLNNDGINQIVYEYVYQGEYDCNLPYWDNLEYLIENAYRQEQFRNDSFELNEDTNDYKVCIDAYSYYVEADNINEAVQIALNEHYESTGEICYTDDENLIVTNLESMCSYQWDPVLNEWEELSLEQEHNEME